MDEKNNYPVNYLFYLQTKPELDQKYYAFAEILAQISICLLPIEIDDLKDLEKGIKNHVIVLRDDFASAYAFKDNCKKYLDSAMSSGKVMIYDVSSFSEIEKAVKFEQKNVYRYFQLPLNVNQVAMTVAVEFYKDRNAAPSVEWPGGKRSKLPSMINSN